MVTAAHANAYPPEPQAPALVVAGLHKDHGGGRGVLGADFNVPRGSVTAFIGVNGAGKSTTLKCVMGLARPDAGEIRLFGAPASFETRRTIGFLPEERGLAPRERARDVIAFYGRLKGMARTAALARADQLLERIGLGARGRARIGELSKGNAQRVQILCAIVHEPELLILDEPFSGLDPIAQSEVQALFVEHRAHGGAILFSTHSMAVAEQLCDRVVVLSKGRTVFEGDVAAATGRAPHGAYVTVVDDAALLQVCAALGGEAQAFPGRMGEALRWRVLLPAHVPYVALMRELAARETALLGFEPIQANLEGAFWALAKDEPELAGREAA
jgi:ABC-2 type transport system ATP-binding protein